MPDTHTENWLTISAVAIQFNKTRQTIHNWCRSGFIITLGYQLRRDPQGNWRLNPPSEDERSTNLLSKM